jgi:ribosomal protein S18 acetylase RimI-like enzyme
MELAHFQIRAVTEADLPDILRIYRQCEDFLALGPAPKASLSMVITDLNLSRAQGGQYCGIYLPGGDLVGVLDTIPQGFEGEPHTAFIELLMIAAPYRGSGLGAAVVQWLENSLCEEFGIHVIRAAVQVNNPWAIRFWRRQGYQIVSEPTLQPDQTVVYQLTKELQGTA